MQQVSVIFFDANDEYKRSVATYPALEDKTTFKGDAFIVHSELTTREQAERYARHVFNQIHGRD